MFHSLKIVKSLKARQEREMNKKGNKQENNEWIKRNVDARKK